ncbi:MAG: hypothetical protein CMJ87_04395 [Planctomycetes bacterium]|nr:hypothetical protein [Planctomycetota bacterium]
MTPISLFPNRRPDDALGAEHEALAGASSSPAVAELPPLSAEGLLGLLAQHPPAVVAQQLLQHAHQGDEIAIPLVQALGESADDTLVARLQDVQWLPGWGQVFRWLLEHDQARQALTGAVRQGLTVPAEPPGASAELLAAPAVEAPRSEPTTPTTPAIPTPVFPGQRLRVDGPFLQQVRDAMNCTQHTLALLFGVRPRTIQNWEANRHRMSPRCEVRLQQILTDPVGAPHFRQLGLVLEFQDPDPSDPPPDGQPAPPSPPQPAPSGLGQLRRGWRRLLGRDRSV